MAARTRAELLAELDWLTNRVSRGTAERNAIAANTQLQTKHDEALAQIEVLRDALNMVTVKAALPWKTIDNAQCFALYLAEFELAKVRAALAIDPPAALAELKSKVRKETFAEAIRPLAQASAKEEKDNQ